MALSAFNYNTQEAEALCKLEANLSYIVRPCLQKRKEGRKGERRKKRKGKVKEKEKKDGSQGTAIEVDHTQI